MPNDDNDGGVTDPEVVDVAEEMGEPEEFSILEAVENFQDGGEPNDQFPTEDSTESTEVPSGSEDEPGGEAEGDTSAPDDTPEEGEPDPLGELDELDPRASTESEETEEEAKDPEEFPDASEIESLQGNERAQAKWNEIRNELEASRAEIASMREAQDNSAITQQYNELREQYAEAQRHLAAFDVETSEDYQNAVGRPLDAIMEAAKAIAERTDGIEADDLYTVMSMDGSQAQNDKMSNLGDHMSEMDKFSFYRMVSDSAQLLAKDRELRENAAEAAVELENARAEATKKQQLENQKKVHASLDPIFDKLGKLVDSPNIDLSKVKERALSEDLYALDADSQAYAVVSSALTVPLLKELKAAQTEIAKLKKETKDLVGANPGVSPKNDSPTADKEDDQLSLFDKVDKELQRVGR